MTKSTHASSFRSVMMLIMAFCTTLTLQAQDQSRMLRLDENRVLTFQQPNRPGKIHINITNASITIRGESRTDIKMNYTSEERQNGEAVNRRAGAPRELNVETSGNTISITGPVDAGDHIRYALQLIIPRGTTLNVVTVNSGQVNIADVSGEVEVSTTNGNTSLSGIEASALVNTINGSIRVFPGAIKPDHRWNLTTMNGNIEILMDRSLPISLDMKTIHGRIDLGPEVEKTSESNQTVGTLVGAIRNGGGAEVTASTMNGTISARVRR